MLNRPEKCPRCGCQEFEERDCGPDTYEDDIVWTAYVCTACDLWYSSWTNQWLVDCEFWWQEEDCEVHPE